jgi:hypothetical protein
MADRLHHRSPGARGSFFGDDVERLLQTFRDQVADAEGARYTVQLHGRSRPGNTWEAWLVFERASDGAKFESGIETTQRDADAIVHWAAGLSDAHLSGALQRALHPIRRDPTPVRAPSPVVVALDDTQGRRRRLAVVDRAVLDCFVRHRVVRLETRRLFEQLSYANADVVRALEDLEKQGGLVVRRTEEGSDWLYLTEEGVRAVGLANVGRTVESVERDLPRPR